MPAPSRSPPSGNPNKDCAGAQGTDIASATRSNSSICLGLVKSGVSLKGEEKCCQYTRLRFFSMRIVLVDLRVILPHCISEPIRCQRLLPLVFSFPGCLISGEERIGLSLPDAGLSRVEAH